MSNYEKQNFVSGQILKAEHLNHMEDGIGQLSEKVGDLNYSEMDYSGNMLPMDKAEESYTVNGVTITHENGVFTYNGTATAGASVEIVPRGIAYATLVGGTKYTLAVNPISGEATTKVAIMLNTDTESVATSDLDVWAFTKAEDKVLTRFALSITAGAIYTNYKIAPYLGLDYDPSYAGGVLHEGYARPKDVEKVDVKVDGLSENVEQLETTITGLKQWGILFNTIGTAAFDTVAKTFTTNDKNKTSRVIVGSESYNLSSAITITLQTNDPSGYIVYSKTTGEFSSYPYYSLSNLASPDYILIAYYSYYGANVYMYGQYKVDGNLYGVEVDPELTTTVDELKTTVDGLDLLPARYTEERDRVIPIVQASDADMRLIVFTDPHSFVADRYKKYNDLLASGCIDGIVGLGDYMPYRQFTKAEAISGLTKSLTYAGRTSNCFYAIGNHDAAFVSANSGEVTQDTVLTKKEMYDCAFRHLSEAAHYNEDDPYGGYFYVDYSAAKIRMVILNTSDIYESDGSLQYKYSESVMMQQPQVTWFAEKALDFSGKNNPSDWSVLVCCHAGLSFRDMLTTILNAAKSGAPIDNTWTFNRRLLTDGTTTVDTSNPVTISVTKDYSQQGAVDVIGIFYGHDHINVVNTANSIKTVGFICDNGEMDDLYVCNVNGMTTGNYYFTALNGETFGFELAEDVANATVVGYVAYLVEDGYGYTNMILKDADGNVLRSARATPTTSVDGMTEISGFEQERTPGTIQTESCSIVSINKDEREISIVPYGTGTYRAFEY